MFVGQIRRDKSSGKGLQIHRDKRGFSLTNPLRRNRQSLRLAFWPYDHA